MWDLSSQTRAWTWATAGKHQVLTTRHRELPLYVFPFLFFRCICAFIFVGADCPKNTDGPCVFYATWQSQLRWFLTWLGLNLSPFFLFLFAPLSNRLLYFFLLLFARFRSKYSYYSIISPLWLINDCSSLCWYSGCFRDTVYTSNSPQSIPKWGFNSFMYSIRKFQ